MKAYVHFRQYLAEFFLKWKILQINFVQKVEVHVLCSKTLFSLNRTVDEVMWKNALQPDSLQMTT